MKQYNAGTLIKVGTSLRYLIGTSAGAAIGKARPDPGQSENDFVNSRMEKIHENSNVLSNMQNIPTLLAQLNLADVRPAAIDHLKNHLIPTAVNIMNNDDGRGVLTEDLARQISDNARELRKGVLERANAITLYDELSDWPKELTLKIFLSMPQWIIGAIFLLVGTCFTAGLGFAQTPLYRSLTKMLSPESDTTAPSNEEIKSRDGADASSQRANVSRYGFASEFTPHDCDVRSKLMDSQAQAEDGLTPHVPLRIHRAEINPAHPAAGIVGVTGLAKSGSENATGKKQSVARV